MTATAMPTTQVSIAVAEWAKIFPKQVTENYTSSVTFMKQLTVVAVSTITYLKNAFPEDSYTVETFGGLKLRILKKKCRDELAQFLSTALTQAFEAFDKKYLHQLALCFYEDECKSENLVEYHIFEYTYSSQGVTMNVHSKSRNSTEQTLKCTFENIKERTIHMIRACVVIMQSCQQELPPCYDVSLRLYYNEDAPDNYQAPGFLNTNEAEDHLAPTLLDTIKLGWVETPYHKLVARSYMKDNLRASHEAIASQNAPVMTQNEIDELTGSSHRSTSEGGEALLRCPCNKYNTDVACADPTDLLTCVYCKTQQHAACFGVPRERAARVEQHCCTACSDSDPTREPTDGRLAALGHKKRECLCMFRRTLAWCSGAAAVCAPQLAALGVTPGNARKLLQLLRSHGVVDVAGDALPETPQKINKEQLKAVMDKFFLSAGEQNIVDRLLAETFASQESRPDPVGEVLSPMEKISLQNATYIGRVVDPIQPPSAAEDATLKQYREAMLSTARDEEEMPLAEALEKGKLGKGKRKLEEQEKPTLRTGVRTKRARALPK